LVLHDNIFYILFIEEGKREKERERERERESIHGIGERQDTLARPGG
jgi:hypothetical protein